MTDGVRIELVDNVKAMAPFALSSWLKAFQPMACIRWGLSKQRYYELFHAELTSLLYQERVSLARLNDAPSVYIGWACGNQKALHWVYVKEPFRRRGFGRKLYDEVTTGALREWESPSGEGMHTFSFEPPTMRGAPKRTLLDVFERWGMDYAPTGLVHELEEKRNDSISKSDDTANARGGERSPEV